MRRICGIIALVIAMSMLAAPLLAPAVTADLQVSYYPLELTVTEGCRQSHVMCRNIGEETLTGTPSVDIVDSEGNVVYGWLFFQYVFDVEPGKVIFSGTWDHTDWNTGEHVENGVYTVIFGFGGNWAYEDIEVW